MKTDNQRPLISIIVPVYKAEKYIRRCLDSIQAQSLTDFEVLLIDDGSPDRSGEICDDYARNDSRFRVFHKKNGGVASARQMGIDNAQGEYIIHCDPDDWVEQNGLERLYHFANDNHLDIAYCDYYGGANVSANTRISQNYGTNTEICIKAMMEGKMHGSLCNKICRMQFIKESKQTFIDGANVWEDLSFNIRLFYLTKKIGYAKDICFYHYDYDSNGTSLTRDISKNIDKIEGMKKNIEIVEKFLHERKELEYSNELLILKSRIRHLLLIEERCYLKQFVSLYPETNDIFIERWKKLNPIYRLSSKLLLKGWINQYRFVTHIGNKIFNLLH